MPIHPGDRDHYMVEVGGGWMFVGQGEAGLGLWASMTFRVMPTLAADWSDDALNATSQFLEVVLTEQLRAQGAHVRTRAARRTDTAFVSNAAYFELVSDRQRGFWVLVWRDELGYSRGLIYMGAHKDEERWRSLIRTMGVSCPPQRL